MVDRGRLDISKDLSFVDPRIRAQAPSDRITLLPLSFAPGTWDVICLGGKEYYDHIGNRRFRICIDNNLKTYVKARSKHEKSLVVTRIVDSIRDSTPRVGGGFVRKDLVSGRWYDVGDKIAREKVGHALRDAIKLKTKNEKASRKQQSLDGTTQQPARLRKRPRSSTSTTTSSPIDVSVPIKKKTTTCSGSNQWVEVDTVSPNCIFSDSMTTFQPQNLQSTASLKTESLLPTNWNGIKKEQQFGSLNNTEIQVRCDLPANDDIEKALKALQAKGCASKESSHSSDDGGKGSGLRNRGGWKPPTDLDAEKQYQASLQAMKMENKPEFDPLQPMKGLLKELNNNSQLLQEPQNLFKALDLGNDNKLGMTSQVNNKMSSSNDDLTLSASSGFPKEIVEPNRIANKNNNVNGGGEDTFQLNNESSMQDLLKAFANRPAIIPQKSSIDGFYTNNNSTTNRIGWNSPTGNVEQIDCTTCVGFIQQPSSSLPTTDDIEKVLKDLQAKVDGYQASLKSGR